MNDVVHLEPAEDKNTRQAHSAGHVLAARSQYTGIILDPDYQICTGLSTLCWVREFHATKSSRDGAQR